MEAQPFSVSASRDGVVGRHGEFVDDDYDEFSNATAGTSSPLGRMDPQSPRSDSKSHQSPNLTPSLESGDVRSPAEPPKQILLNHKNLQGFAAGMGTGNLPLRTDVIPNDEYVDYAANVPKMDMAKKWREARADISVVTVAGRTQELGDLGSDATGSNLYESNTSLHGAEASLEGNAWNIEQASVDAQVGSPTCRQAYPLNTATLDQHLHDLTNGPAPLFVENITTNIATAAHECNMSTMAVAPEETVASNAIDPSEGDMQSYSEVISPLHNRSQKQSSVEDMLDDMWSTSSTRGPNGNPFSFTNSDENPHALSKENLRQLRHQLESGETPLRPEVLAGLGTMVRVMTQTNSNKSASTAVEAAATEDRSKQLGVDTSVGSLMQSFTDPRNAAMLAPLRGAKEIGTSAVTGMSFHSTLVDVPVMEPRDCHGVGKGKYPSAQFTMSEPVDASSPDVDEEDVGNVDEVDEEDAVHGKSSSEDSREGQNESIFNMTEDDGVDDMGDNSPMARHMRELFKLVQESQRDQTHLRLQVLEQRSVIQRLQNTVRQLEAELSAIKKQ